MTMNIGAINPNNIYWDFNGLGGGRAALLSIHSGSEISSPTPDGGSTFALLLLDLIAEEFCKPRGISVTLSERKLATRLATQRSHLVRASS
jgi:hypothetical protein